jgi:hypothetical protein
VTLAAVLSGHTAEISGLAFASPYPVLISADTAGIINVWHVSPGRKSFPCLATFAHEPRPAPSASVLGSAPSSADHALQALLRRLGITPATTDLEMLRHLNALHRHAAGPDAAPRSAGESVTAIGIIPPDSGAGGDGDGGTEPHSSRDSRGSGFTSSRDSGSGGGGGGRAFPTLVVGDDLGRVTLYPLDDVLSAQVLAAVATATTVELDDGDDVIVSSSSSRYPAAVAPAPGAMSVQPRRAADVHATAASGQHSTSVGDGGVLLRHAIDPVNFAKSPPQLPNYNARRMFRRQGARHPTVACPEQSGAATGGSSLGAPAGMASADGNTLLRTVSRGVFGGATQEERASVDGSSTERGDRDRGSSFYDDGATNDEVDVTGADADPVGIDTQAADRRVNDVRGRLERSGGSTIDVVPPHTPIAALWHANSASMGGSVSAVGNVLESLPLLAVIAGAAMRPLVCADAHGRSAHEAGSGAGIASRPSRADAGGAGSPSMRSAATRASGGPDGSLSLAGGGGAWDPAPIRTLSVVNTRELQCVLTSGDDGKAVALAWETLAPLGRMGASTGLRPTRRRGGSSSRTTDGEDADADSEAVAGGALSPLHLSRHSGGSGSAGPSAAADAHHPDAEHGDIWQLPVDHAAREAFLASCAFGIMRELDENARP